MTMNPLPPQAYTKDTLVLAYAWLQSQSESIIEIATSPDILVSLYLKAKLQGDSALERPSIKNFKSELKSLAGMMGEFEVVNSDKPSNIRVQSHPEPKTEQKSDTHSMDLQSMTMIQEVKSKLNLSSEQEALRLLISVGYNHAKLLFK
jgi:hypothetical protein